MTTMPHDSTVEHLRATLEGHVASYSRARKENKRKAFAFKMITLTLGLIATLVLGIETDDSQKAVLKNAAFVCTCCITFFTGVDLFYNHKALWVRYTETLNELKAIRAQLEYSVVSSEGPIPKEQLDSLHQRLQACLASTNDWWATERKKGEL